MTGAPSENKTRPTGLSPTEFIATVENATRRADAEFLLDWFHQITGLAPAMWGATMVGYGRYHYKYASGREGDAMITGFSPRTGSLSVYIMPGYQDMTEKLSRLGKHKMGKSCLYINKLSDIDMEVLREIVEEGVTYMKKNYDTWDA